MSNTSLIEAALKAFHRSYAPYSGFHVGAALLAEDGEVYCGCNVENASYSVTSCAERTAFYKAVSEGRKKFKAIVIVGGYYEDTLDYCPPCGVCRQVMREFCGPDFKIILAKGIRSYKEYTLKELLPESFGPEDLV